MNFSNVGPSHGPQFFTNCSSVGPIHGVESFRSTLLQCGSLVGSQVLPENLLQCGLLSPQIRRSCQEPAPARASHGVTASFEHPPALAWGPPWAAGGYLLHCGPPWAAGGQPASCLTMGITTGCRVLSALAPGASPPPPSSLTWVSAGLFLSYSPSSLQQQLLLCRLGFFFPFLNLLSQRHYHCY